MPFTFSHPAVVLPANYFLKKRISLTGLIAGSMVPDFEYFVRDYHKSFYSHTWLGLFYIDLPAGLLLCFLYHNLIRRPFYANAPLFLKRKLAAFQALHWNSWFAAKWRTVLLCILAGAITHLVWDKLTHHTVPLVQSASGFRKFASFKDKMMTYFLFWDMNSLIGLFLVLYSFWLLPTDKKVQANTDTRPYWLSLCGTALLVFLVQLPGIKLILDNIVIAAINAALISIALTSLVFNIRFRYGKNLVWATKK